MLTHQEMVDYANRMLAYQPTQLMVLAHLQKPWAPNFYTVVIRPAQFDTDPTFFDRPFGKALGASWYLPSLEWWKAHAHSSHPPNGLGCSVDVHTDFLSAEGTAHEFDYANVFQNGSLKILGRRDFSVECRWWGRYFG